MNVRTTAEFQEERQLPGYVYEQEKHLHEYWIALGQYSFSVDLSQLAFVINYREQVLPINIQTRQELSNYVRLFRDNEEKVISAFDRVIGKPNQIFIGYTEPITMEQYLQRVVSSIHEEALNLDYNYQKFKSLSTPASTT